MFYRVRKKLGQHVHRYKYGLPDFVRSVPPSLFLSLVFCTYTGDFETRFSPVIIKIQLLILNSKYKKLSFKSDDKRVKNKLSLKFFKSFITPPKQ